MSIQLASEILRRLGPCAVLIDRAEHAALARELALAGCTVVDPADMDAQARTGTPTAAIISSPLPPIGAGRPNPLGTVDRLVLLPSAGAGADAEDALFASGWERHPGDMSDHDFAARGQAAGALRLFRRARAETPAFPLRTGGAQADACIARYALAARHARPGDRVLIDGSASDAGRAILVALSRAGDIVGNEGALDVDAASIDLIVAFDAPAHEGWRARLDAYAAALKPDGRIILGWQAGDGETAPDRWDAFHEALCEHFLPETRYLHIVPAGDWDAPRALHPVAIDAGETGDWLLAVASANPLDGAASRDAYRHPAFGRQDSALPALVDFGAAYDNPYLYRVMVQLGERLHDQKKLARLAEIVALEAAEASADRGAAIAVLGYRVLEMRLVASVAPLLGMIEAYRLATDGGDPPPHVARWRVSLAFLAGRLTELADDKARAIHWFAIAALDEWRRFSPILATKAVAASFHQARLHLAEGDVAAACACFRQGFDTSLAAAACPHDNQIGDRGRPLPFYMQELAEVIEMGSQCASALANIALWQRDPGLFWRQVDIRRFGLASWALDLERENERLRGGR